MSAPEKEAFCGGSSLEADGALESRNVGAALGRHGLGLLTGSVTSSSFCLLLAISFCSRLLSPRTLEGKKRQRGQLGSL